MNRRWRRAAFALLGGIGLTSLVGCWGIAPIEKTGMVTLLGVDRAERGGYRVTASVDMPSASSTSPGLGQVPGVLVRHAEAPDLAVAIQRLRTMSFLSLDFSHVEAVVLSESVAREGAGAPLALLGSAPEMVTTPWLLVARGMSAYDVLTGLKAVTPRPDEVLIDTAVENRQRTPYRPLHLYSFLRDAQSDTDEAVTAGLVVDAAQGTGREAAPRLTGDALFRRDALVGWLDGPPALGWLLVAGRVRQQTFAVPWPPGRVVFQIVRSQRSVRVVRQGGGPMADIRVRVALRLLASEGAAPNWWRSPVELDRAREGAAEILVRDALDALRQAKRVGADVFGLGEYVRAQDARDWPALAAHWSERGFRRLPVAVSVRVTVDTLGEVVCPVVDGAC
ncbi:MAG: hypothetical protein K6V73_02900 [Firmicutes bacterium]|nr:hypothetical protein [Bacillota bacterium]